MAVNWILPVRGLQVVLSLVVLGLMAYVANWWTTHWRQMSPVEVNFMVFAPVWSFIAACILTVVPMKSPSVTSSTVPKLGLIAYELFTMLCWFGGFIALAVFLHDRICFGTVCSVAKAGTAISAVSWLTWAVTFGFALWRLFRGERGGAMRAGEPKVEMHQGV